jgi:uncharacterized protein involved in exopolysaccharide biosynthesis
MRKVIHSPTTTFFPIVRQHAAKIVCTFLGVMALAVIYTAISPVLYTSEAKLFVRLGRETVALDPTATTNQTVNVQETRENELNSIYELLKSRAMIEQLVDTFGIESILGNSSGTQAAAESPAAGSPALETPAPVSIWTQLNPLTTYSQRDKAIRKLAKRLSVEPVRKSNIINLSCEATDPLLAQKLVNAAIELARTTHIRVNRTVGSFDFFDAQSKDQAQRLAELEERWRDLKNKTGIADVGEERVILQRRIATVEDERLKTAAGLAAALGQSKARGHTALLQGDGPVAALTSQLTTIEAQLTETREAMSAFNSAELELVRLEREIAREKTSFNKSAESRELARIDQAMQDEKISNLNILQAPSYSITPARPKVVVNMALGFVLALIACCGVVGLIEIRTRRPGSADDPLNRTSWDGVGLEPILAGYDAGHGNGNGHGTVQISSSDPGLRHAPR